jgi:hypothetical protein
MVTLQYLESPPKSVTPEHIRETLRRAFSILPVSAILLGWDLPPKLEEAAAKETSAHRVDLYRWHPLLTSDAGFSMPREWQTVGPGNQPVGGYKGMASFTFLCPNRSAVQEWVAERIETVISQGFYQGIFFDRMRLPSPAADPARELACFCRQCTRLAADSGLDFEAVRETIQRSATRADDALALVRSLLGNPSTRGENPLEAFLAFRTRSVTRLVRFAALQAQSAGLKVGFDAFSPSLARMVGQDLSALGNLKAWIKIMTYPHVFGPAGLPFELLALADWLIRCGVGETDALTFLSEASGLPIPVEMPVVREQGLSSRVMRIEIQKAREQTGAKILAGMALVQMAGVHNASDDVLRADLKSCKEAGPDGLALSWDLRLISPERLALAGEFT